MNTAAQRWTRPADIRARVLREWERGRLLALRLDAADDLFPWRIPLKAPGAAELSARFAEAHDWIRVLADSGAAEGRGGYRLEFRAVEHRQLGRNEVPVAAWIDHAADALALIGKRREAQRFDEIVAATRAACPALLPWLARRPLKALEHGDNWTRLLAVVRCLHEHPRPNVYLRQIDVAGVHSKFIERNKGLLAELLDLALPDAAVDRAQAGAARFEARYGLRSKPVLLRLRFPDPECAMVPRFGGNVPSSAVLSDLAITAEAFAALDAPVERVFITENEINFLAFPPAPRCLVLFGAGYGFEAIDTAWMRNRAIHYWGDIDTHGFAILDSLRSRFAHARALLMDRATLIAHREHWTEEPEPVTRDLARLAPDEAALYDELRGNRLGAAVRLEQERVGFANVRQAVERVLRG